MQIRAEQLDARLATSLAPLYTVHGDEPLLAQEAADAVRAAARRGGCSEREVLAADRHFDWSRLVHAGASASLFGGAKLVELRIASGRPGSEGAAAIVRYCARLAPGNVTLVALPRLDRAGQSAAWFRALGDAGVVVEVWPLERARLPEWISARLARNGQRAGRELLEFLADRVEGNLLAAHQEVAKLALLLPPGELRADEVQAAVANVARYDAFDASAALLAADLPRYARVLEGLRGEGTAPNHVLWAISEELRGLRRICAGLAAGRPLDALLRENRVWGARQAAVRGAARRCDPAALARALGAAARIDREIKGVAPGEPWNSLLALGLEWIRGTEGARKVG
jgi:DNA polymerase-3 subunit delta